MSLLLRIFQFARPFRTIVPQYLVYTFLGIIFGLASIVLVIPLLEVIFDQIDETDLAVYRDLPQFEWSLNYPEKVFLPLLSCFYR